jgi:hypothetical protein
MQENNMLNLQRFCSEDDFRESLRKPFSHGEYSYATNGVYAVRVPRREDVPEGDKPNLAEQLDRILAPLEGASFEAIDFTVPDLDEPSSTEECEDCDGRGLEHECPDCDCECTTCGGTGSVEKTESISVSALGGIFRLPYLRRILALPEVEVASLPRDYETPKPALFRFDGGVAALMLMRREYPRHVKWERPSVALSSPT